MTNSDVFLSTSILVTRYRRNKNLYLGCVINFHPFFPGVTLTFLIRFSLTAILLHFKQFLFTDYKGSFCDFSFQVEKQGGAMKFLSTSFVEAPLKRQAREIVFSLNFSNSFQRATEVYYLQLTA